MADIKNEIPDQEYAYGFNDGDVSVFKTPKGINEEIVTEISKIKNEPEWMLEYRLKSYRCFMEKPMPTWGVNLDRIDLMNILITFVLVINKRINGKKYLKQLNKHLIN
mgnify:CR=1 FL=1